MPPPPPAPRQHPPPSETATEDSASPTMDDDDVSVTVSQLFHEGPDDALGAFAKCPCCEEMQPCFCSPCTCDEHASPMGGGYMLPGNPAHCPMHGDDALF